VTAAAPPHGHSSVRRDYAWEADARPGRSAGALSGTCPSLARARNAPDYSGGERSAHQLACQTLNPRILPRPPKRPVCETDLVRGRREPATSSRTGPCRGRSDGASARCRPTRIGWHSAGQASAVSGPGRNAVGPAPGRSVLTLTCAGHFANPCPVRSLAGSTPVTGVTEALPSAQAAPPPSATVAMARGRASVRNWATARSPALRWRAAIRLARPPGSAK